MDMDIVGYGIQFRLFCLIGHPKIIHRDIKAANILLDFKFEAMVLKFSFLIVVLAES